MWCKSCKTAVPSGVTVCPVCGAKVRTGNRLTIALICILLAAALAGGVYLFFSLTGTDIFSDASGRPVDGDQDPTVFPETTQQPSEILSVPSIPSNDAPEEPEVPRQDLTIAALSGIISSVPTDGEYISKEGYLYDYNKDQYVTAQVLADEGLLDPELSALIEGFNSKPLLLYLLPGDVEKAGLSGLESLEQNIDTYNSELRIFAAADGPDGISITDGQGLRGKIFREDLNQTLSVYASGQGEIIRPGQEDPSYREFVDLALEHGLEGQFDVRYLAMNEKYAVLIITSGITSGLTPEDESHSFLFKYSEISENEFGWALVLSDMAELDNIIVEINMLFPDMDLNLLPPFDIKNMLFDETNDEWLEAAELMGLGTEPDFVSGYGNFAYISADDNNYYIEKYDEKWICTRVENYGQALERLERRDSLNYSYILLQE